MKVRTSKKVIIVLVSLFIFLFVGGVFYWVWDREETSLLKPPEIEDSLGNSLNSFIELCSEGTNSSEIVCKAFIKDEMEVIGENVDFTCLDLLVYSHKGGVVDANMRLCIDSPSLDWDNPYGDYDKYVPVVIEMSLRGGTNELQEISLVLMEDEELFTFLDSLPEDQGRVSHFSSLIYVQEVQEVLDKGYYITTSVETDSRDILVIHDAQVEDISAQEGEVVLLLNTRIYGEDLRIFIYTEEFYFSKTGFIEESGVLIDVDDINLFDKSLDFFVFLRFNLEERGVEEYMQSLSSSEDKAVVLEGDFNLIELLAKE